MFAAQIQDLSATSADGIIIAILPNRINSSSSKIEVLQDIPNGLQGFFIRF